MFQSLKNLLKKRSKGIDVGSRVVITTTNEVGYISHILDPFHVMVIMDDDFQPRMIKVEELKIR